ncbi:hypothetical protein HWV62_15589 [Athelia sp. TMB]|nr:hypothetical protein HWV62_15589 [Athelia sp. TMB]
MGLASLAAGQFVSELDDNGESSLQAVTIAINAFGVIGDAFITATLCILFHRARTGTTTAGHLPILYRLPGFGILVPFCLNSLLKEFALLSY